jgi:hypothetical protein
LVVDEKQLLSTQKITEATGEHISMNLRTKIKIFESITITTEILKPLDNTNCNIIGKKCRKYY